MSNETLQSLNTNTLIGHTSRRGTAWHYKAELQGNQPNHYPGPIPIEDVRTRLFSWTAVSRPVAVERPAALETMTHWDSQGYPVRWVVVPDRRAIVREADTAGPVFGVFSADYVPHQYTEWLLTNVTNILDDGLSISSAGLLKAGAVAWVEVSVPESVRTPEGVEFRPNLLATTTLDGSLATTYKRTVTDVVCDNTRHAALTERGAQIKVRHSRHEKLTVATAKEALQLVYTTADAFAAEVSRLCQISVPDRAWSLFLDELVPMKDGRTGQPLIGRRLTGAQKRRADLETLYRRDPRSAPWRGTAHAVVQAVNTYEHHVRGPADGATRLDRNMKRMVTGAYDDLDRATWLNLSKVLEQG